MKLLKSILVGAGIMTCAISIVITAQVAVVLARESYGPEGAMVCALGLLFLFGTTFFTLVHWITSR